MVYNFCSLINFEYISVVDWVFSEDLNIDTCCYYDEYDYKGKYVGFYAGGQFLPLVLFIPNLR